MKAIIKQELKNYVKNPIFWIGLLLILFQLYQILNPYLQIHYFQSEQEIEALEPENIVDADITEGYIKSTKGEQLALAFGQLQIKMAEALDMTEEETGRILEGIRQKGMTVNEITVYLNETYGWGSGFEYYYARAEYHQGDMQEANTYIEERLASNSFSYYFGGKFADFCGLFMGFFSTILLAFLFIRDTKKDTYELLHTKPVSARSYIVGKVFGGFLAMVMAWAVMTIVFGVLCELYALKNGLPGNFLDFLGRAVIYILPNILMITSIYTAVALLFKNPLPAVPCIFLYLIYSNMGSIGPDGNYGYYGRPLAIMVRFPGKFFDTAPPPLTAMNQTFLVFASILLIACAAAIWKRRRAY